MKSSSIFFYCGIVLLLIGTYGFTYGYEIAIIAVILFIMGIVFVFLSKKSWILKVLPLSICVIAIVVFELLWNVLHTFKQETFLIPEDYRGKVIVAFNEEYGILLEETENGYVYEIPDDGILLLQNEERFGFINHKFFLVDKQGKRTELPKIDFENFEDYEDQSSIESSNSMKPSIDELGVFKYGILDSTTVLTSSRLEVKEEIRYVTYSEVYITTYKKYEEDFGWRYENKFDSIRDSKLESCQ